jgi:lipoyl-dependent peroxiredoxin
VKKGNIDMKRTASAQWSGSAREGSGSLTTQSAVLDATPYSFNTRFGDGKGTNPEELLAAAHAGCFTMATSFALSNAGFPPQALDTEAVVTVEQVDGGFSITAIHLEMTASVPGIDDAQFQGIAAGAKANCPLSKALAAVPITLNATLRL